MSFLHPEFLYYLLPPLIILFGLLLTQKPVQESFFSQEVMAKLRVSANTLTLQARNAIFFLIALLITIALADPVIKDGKVEVKAKSADIMIALDISDSMLAEDVYPNRLKLAKQKALALLKMAPQERIGVIGFAKNSYLVSPLSFDSAAVAFLLSKLNTDSITEKGTNFLSMLEVVNKSMKKEAKKYLLLLSDGGDQKDFSKEIAYAKEKGIVVFVLGLGTKKGAPIKKEDGTFIKQNGQIIISKLNSDISDLATKTGGVYIQNVNSTQDIEKMLQEIEAHSVKKELKSQEIEKYIPLFYYPLGLALMLLLIATSSMSKRVKVNVPVLFILFMFSLGSYDAKAGVLDFLELDKAKKAYENGEYKTSQSLYSQYEKNSKHSQAHYNIGNTLYKQGKYKDAIKEYQQALFHDASSNAKNYANLGNAYAKSDLKDGLEKAVKAYEKSLKLEEDKDTRENLEAVKKALKKQKQQQQKNKNQNKKNQDKNKKNQDKKNQDKNNKDQKKQDKNKSEKNDKKNKENQINKSDKKSDDAKQKEKEKKEQQKKEQEKKGKKSEQENQKNKTKELKDKNATAPQQQIARDMKDKMSEKEEKKWLKQLNKQQGSFMYKLNKNSKMEENSDEKPW